MVRNGRPRVSAWTSVGVSACTAVLRAAACSAAPRSPPFLAACQVGRYADGAVDVPGRLLPRVERHRLPGVVWLQDRHRPLGGVVAQGRADADPAVEPEAGRVVEERLEPLH